MGDMAVSNSIGSNVFDILIGLGLPWALQTLAVNYGSYVSPTFVCITFIYLYTYLFSIKGFYIDWLDLSENNKKNPKHILWIGFEETSSFALFWFGGDGNYLWIYIPYLLEDRYFHFLLKGSSLCCNKLAH